MKRIKFLLVMCGVLIILAAAYLITLTLTKDNKNKGDDGTDTGTPLSTTYTAAKIDIQTLNALSYNVGDTSYTFTLNDAEDAWLWSDHPGLPLENSFFAAMASALNSLTSSVKLTADSAVLAEYGLEKPWLTVTVSDGVNGVQSFMFGKKNSFNQQYYFMSGAEKYFIYMVSGSAASPFSATPYEMIKNDSIPAIAANNVKSLTLKSEAGEWVYVYYPDGMDGNPETNDLWYLSSDGRDVALDEEISIALNNEISSLEFGNPAGYTDADKEKYGLDRPVVLTIFYIEEKSVTDEVTGNTVNISVDSTAVIELGKTDGEDGVYVSIPGSVLTYRVSSKILVLLYQSALSETTRVSG